MPCQRFVTQLPLALERAAGPVVQRLDLRGNGRYACASRGNPFLKELAVAHKRKAEHKERKPDAEAERARDAHGNVEPDEPREAVGDAQPKGRETVKQDEEREDRFQATDN